MSVKTFAGTYSYNRCRVCCGGWVLCVNLAVCSFDVLNIVYNEHAQLNAVNTCTVKKGGAQGVEHITQQEAAAVSSRSTRTNASS